MSQVIYARVPDSLKQALASRAHQRELNLTATVVELLEQGLEASDDQRAERLERALATAAGQLEQTRARLAEAKRTLTAAKRRQQLTSRTLRALAERARQQLASCPGCRKPLRGSDLFVSGHCPHCNRAITNLLSPRPQTGAPDKDEYLALIGALGGLLGLALATSS